MKMTMKFPLSDIQRESELYNEQVKIKFGAKAKFENLVANKINISK